jgi:iron complex outermembrane receptor protein
MGVRLPHSSAPASAVASAVLRALSLCAPAALLETAATPAQAAEPAALTSDIPAQSLTRALAAFGRQTGLQLIYVSKIADAQRSGGARAGATRAEALTQLLADTGLQFEFLNARTVRIYAAPAAAPALVPTPAPVAGALQHVAEGHAARTLAFDEVVVTANRREEKIQDVPIAIQVLTNDTLARLQAVTLDDFVKYLPGVTAHGVGAGQSNIYVRGLATAVTGVQSSGVIGAFPNVAVYLDEQSTQLAHRNLDIYAADLERIEVLEGPQGTLFGAGAQAGVIRYITNKPKLNAIEATVNAGFAATAHGGPSEAIDAVVNLPVIADKLAVRAVLYSEHRGGYIDNSPATFARADTDPAMQVFGGHVPVNSVVINNFQLAGANINTVAYKGGRVAALYQFNDDWNALLAQSYQAIDAQGVAEEMAADSLGRPQPDLSTQLFNASYDKDRFENTALTISGRVGSLKLLYAGSYLVRNVEQVQDYTSYARSTYSGYYQCANLPVAPQCFTPSSTWQDSVRNTHQSHELRISTIDDRRIRGVGGLFYEDYRIQEQADGLYRTAVAYFQPIGPPTGYCTINGSRLLPGGHEVFCPLQGAVFVPYPVTSNNPDVRPPNDGFFNDITRAYKQKAAYTSLDFDLIRNRLTLALGTRYFNIETSEVGSAVFSFYCSLIYYPSAPNPCLNGYSFNLDSEGLIRSYSGFRSRANLSWKVTKDAMLYYTWSQGFRAGTFNRVSSPLALGGSAEHGGWVPPRAFAPDDLVNNELGWKTQWADGRIRWDGAAYQEDWNHAQIGLFAPNVINYVLTINGGSYRVRGLETSGAARITPGLTIEAGANWNHSELVREAPFVWADGTPVDFSTLLTANGQKVSNPGGSLGSSLAGAPSFAGNIRARYEFKLNGYDAFAQFSAVHQSHSFATTDHLTLDLQGKSIAYDLPAFTTYDAALGIGKGVWRVQVYAENLTDVRAQTYANYAQFYKSITVSRPRTLGLLLTYRLGSD